LASPSLKDGDVVRLVPISGHEAPQRLAKTASGASSHHARSTGRCWGRTRGGDVPMRGTLQAVPATGIRERRPGARDAAPSG
jgi:hypothetical protein